MQSRCNPPTPTLFHGMLAQMVMEGRRFATLLCEDLTTEYNCSTASPEQDLLVECAGLKVRLPMPSGLRV